MRRSRLFPLSCLATLIFALSGGPLLAADAPAVDPEAELARAAALHAEASAIRDAATLRFSDEDPITLLVYHLFNSAAVLGLLTSPP